MILKANVYALKIRWVEVILVIVLVVMDIVVEFVNLATNYHFLYYLGVASNHSETIEK
jgi:hypothetical protein